VSDDKNYSLNEISEEERLLVIDVLKASCLYEDLLSEFERQLIHDFRARFRQFGLTTSIYPKQWAVLKSIGDKLALPTALEFGQTTLHEPN
jgi:hypothetical protein